MVGKKVAKTYTLEELTNFEPTTINDEEFGVNARGDCIDGDGAFVGVYDTVKKVLNRAAKVPSDWAEVSAAQ